MSTRTCLLCGRGTSVIDTIILDQGYCLHPAAENCSIDALRGELKDLHDEGVADVMEPTMAEEAHIIRHYEQFMDLLEERSADKATGCRGWEK